MLGINGGEFVVLLLVALVIVGPERLPRYAEQLGTWARTAKRFALTARERVNEELGDDVKDVDWAALDPRRYDPRRIVREALLDDDSPQDPRAVRPVGAAAASAAPTRGAPAVPGTGGGSLPPGAPAPFDDEAT